MKIEKSKGPPKRLVGVNENGRRVGQDHPGAVLTDRDVDLVFELREQGLGYRRIAKKIEVSVTAIKKIIKGKMRAQRAARFKVVV